MKTIILMFMLVTYLGAGRLAAQETDSITSLPPLTVTAGTSVNKEIDKAFRKTFPTAQNAKWYKVNKFYLVKFIQDDVKHRALFSMKGAMQYDISYGNENMLPPDAVTKIKQAYYEYNISRVANVKQAGRNIWMINLDNLKHFILVRMEDDEMEEVKILTKTM